MLDNSIIINNFEIVRFYRNQCVCSRSSLSEDEQLKVLFYFLGSKRKPCQGLIITVLLLKNSSYCKSYHGKTEF